MSCNHNAPPTEGTWPPQSLSPGGQPKPAGAPQTMPTLRISETRMLLLTMLVVLYSLSPVGADATQKLLSENATYRITGGGYVYANQIQPGVNEAAKQEGIVLTPLVEPTDVGDELIDGNRSDASKVHTTWHWNQPGKVIGVEMKLPGDSAVDQVRVTFPENTDYRPESVTLELRRSDGNWHFQGRNFVHHERDPVEESPQNTTFELAGVLCRELKFSIGGNREYVGVTEIEVWGDGPTENDRRGLIRSRPHVETVELPVAEVPQGALKLSTMAKIHLETSHVPLRGDSASLVDGKRTTGLHLGGKLHQHWHVIAELDLGEVYQVEAIHIWMPGGRGTETGHLHQVTLAISPSADFVDWQSPVAPLVPVYWPTDDAPTPYVIPANRLNVPGRRVRIEAYLSGTGGVTSKLAIGEIEVWGRPLDRPQPNIARLELKPVTIESEPIGQLAPRWQTLRQRRIRGIWIAGDLDDQFGNTKINKAQVLAEAGFNTVVLYTGVDRKNRSIAPELAGRIRRNVAQARKHNLLLLAKWQFGTTHQEPYRRFRANNGIEHESSCCPLQPDYVDRHIGRWAVKCAQLGADGFTFDTEMYESDSTHYPSACYCDSCFIQYLQDYSTNSKHHYRSIAPGDRGKWVAANKAGNHYSQSQRRHLIGIFDDIRARCQAINPEYLLCYAPFVDYLSGLTRGLGTPDRPVIVWSEREYTHGPESRTLGYLKKIRDDRLPALYASGHMLWYQDPQKLADNLVVAALHTDGWWAWLGTALLSYPGKEDPQAYKSPYGRAAGTSAADYLTAIKSAHERLDQLLDQPPHSWPRAEMFADVLHRQEDDPPKTD